MSVSYWMDQGRFGQMEFDIAIIGGGIAGLSTAYWLKKEDPTLKIAVIEKYQLGDGATGRNAGFITCGSVEHFNRLVGKFGAAGACEIWRFSEENLHLLREEIIRDQESRIDFQTQGSFSLASTSAELLELNKSADIMRSLKIDVEKLDDVQIESRLGVRGFVGGIKYIGDSSVHPLKLLGLVQSRISECTGEPVNIFENAEVFSIESEGSLRYIKTKQGVVKSSLVVIATNGYSCLLNNYFETKIFPTRGQILAVEPVPMFMEGPCYANFVLDYFRQLPTGQLLIGGFRQLQKDVEVGFSDQTTLIIQSALEKFIDDHIPVLRGRKITHRWAGIMGFSVDGQPMVGSLPNDPQIYFLGGFTGHGLGLAFHVAKCLVDSMFHRSFPDFISAKRFI